MSRKLYDAAPLKTDDGLGGVLLLAIALGLVLIAVWLGWIVMT